MAASRNTGGPNGENPWIKKTLLTLDGGGVRGYSSLLILKALMSEVANLEQRYSPTHGSVHPLEPRLRRPVRMQRVQTDTFGRDLRQHQTQSPVFGPACASSFFLPAHYFDYIAGTSTGGLIAIMLGRLRMNVDECLEAYENLADYVFRHPRRFHIRKPPFIPRDKYDHTRLEKIIKDIVKERSPTGHNSTVFPQTDKDMCRTIVIAWRKLNITGTRKPYLFRSYVHPITPNETLERNPGEPKNSKIWEVGRATSAAPTYFEAIRLEEGDKTSDYIDGGMGANNPTFEAYKSVKQLHNNNRKNVKVLVSIGTGRQPEADGNPRRGYAHYWAYLNLAAKWATESEATHQTMLDFTSGSTDYFRLNVRHGIGGMKLDEWKGKNGCKTLDWIRTKTEDYLNSHEGRQQVSGSARRLVEVRRARSVEAYRDRWERFCHGVYYACFADDCPNGSGETYPTRDAFERHVQEFHPSEFGTLASRLDACKRFPAETNPEETTP